MLPCLVLGLFTTSLLELLKKHMNVVKYTVKVGGILMVLMGLFMFTGKMNAVTGYLSKVSIAGNETENAKKQKNQSAAQQKNTGQDNTSGEKKKVPEKANRKKRRKTINERPFLPSTLHYKISMGIRIHYQNIKERPFF